MNQQKIRLFLGIVILLGTVFALIFLILLYSLAILDLVNDGLMGPFIFVAFVVALVFTTVWAINRLLTDKSVDE